MKKQIIIRIIAYLVLGTGVLILASMKFGSQFPYYLIGFGIAVLFLIGLYLSAWRKAKREEEADE